MLEPNQPAGQSKFKPSPELGMAQTSDKAKVLYGDHHPLLLGYLDEQEQLHFQADPSFYPKGAKTSSGLS